MIHWRAVTQSLHGTTEAIPDAKTDHQSRDRVILDHLFDDMGHAAELVFFDVLASAFNRVSNSQGRMAGLRIFGMQRSNVGISIGFSLNYFAKNVPSSFAK